MWEGICHGWAAAAIQVPRPERTLSVRSADGRFEIPFAPDDLKALYSHRAGAWAGAVTRFGSRCTGRDSLFKKPCSDVKPDQFHEFLVEFLGRRKQAFVMDLDPSPAVWNQPVSGYRSQLCDAAWKPTRSPESAIAHLSRRAREERGYPRSAAFTVNVKTVIRYLKETYPDPSAETDSPSRDLIEEREYTYELALDSSLTIVGGTWTEGAIQPDFAWLPGRQRSSDWGAPAFVQGFDRLEQALRASALGF